MTPACAWCDGSGFRLTRAKPGTTTHPEGLVSCSHPGPVEIRALPGAEWRVTKYESAGDSRLSGRHAGPTWKAPADVGRAFALACKNPVPGPEDVDRLPDRAPARPRAPRTTAPDREARRILAALVADFDTHNAQLSARGGYRYSDTPAVVQARALLKKESAA